MNKLLIKGKITINDTLIVQILYTIDNRVQLFLSYLRRANDLDDVNDSITDFTPMANDIVLGQLHVVLPVTITCPTVTKDDENKHDGPPRGKRRKKAAGSLTPLGEIEGGDRRDDNRNIPTEFRLKENESYKNVFVNRHILSSENVTRTARTSRATWIALTSHPPRSLHSSSFSRYAGGDDRSGRSIAVSDHHLHLTYLYQHYSMTAITIAITKNQFPTTFHLDRRE